MMTDSSNVASMPFKEFVAMMRSDPGFHRPLSWCSWILCRKGEHYGPDDAWWFRDKHPRRQFRERNLTNAELDRYGPSVRSVVVKRSGSKVPVIKEPSDWCGRHRDDFAARLFVMNVQ